VGLLFGVSTPHTRPPFPTVATLDRQRGRERSSCGLPDGLAVSIGTGIAEMQPGMGTEALLRTADRALSAEKARRCQLRSTA
jgi:PleD family two-component response regulator